MRGDDQQQGSMYSYVTMERRIREDHPVRRIRGLVDRALERMDTLLEAMYASRGRPSIAPERLLRAQLLMILYSIRSERQLMEQLDYNLLFRWFVGLEMDDPVWDVTVFTKNRERLISGEASQQLLVAVLEQAREHRLLSEAALHGGRNANPGLGLGAELQGKEGPSCSGFWFREGWGVAAARQGGIDDRCGCPIV